MSLSYLEGCKPDDLLTASLQGEPLVPEARVSPSPTASSAYMTSLSAFKGLTVCSTKDRSGLTCCCTSTAIAASACFTPAEEVASRCGLLHTIMFRQVLMSHAGVAVKHSSQEGRSAHNSVHLMMHVTIRNCWQWMTFAARQFHHASLSQQHQKVYDNYMNTVVSTQAAVTRMTVKGRLINRSKHHISAGQELRQQYQLLFCSEQLSWCTGTPTRLPAPSQTHQGCSGPHWGCCHTALPQTYLPNPPHWLCCAQSLLHHCPMPCLHSMQTLKLSAKRTDCCGVSGSKPSAS